MKNVLVTGASGFVGSWLVKELIDNEMCVTAVVRTSSNVKELETLGVDLLYCDIEDYNALPEKLKGKKIDTVYHLAWQGVSDDYVKDYEIQMANIDATMEIIKNTKKIGAKTFIGAGSLHEIESAYEIASDRVISNMGYMYKTAKLAAHWMGKALAGSLGVNFFWPVISNTYGVGEKSKRLINSIIRCIIANESPKLSQGNQNYDFVYVSDVARAFRLIGEHGVNGTEYFIGSGKVKPLRQYLDVVARITNEINNSNIELGYGMINSNVVDLPEEVFKIDSLVRDTAFEPKISFEDGITQTVNWIIQNERL